MNQNDYRLKMYKNSSSNASTNDAKDEEARAKPFVPKKIFSSNKSSKSGNGTTKENIKESRTPFNEAKTFNNTKSLNKDESSLELKDATDFLKNGGLIKVPIAQNHATNQNASGDSTYRRVAKFLLLIGVDRAAEVLKHLSQEETEKIIPEIASIRTVGDDEAEGILNEFSSLTKRVQESGGLETAKNILEKAFGSDKASDLMSKVPVLDLHPFEYLNEKENEQILFLLKDESEAIRALVLSYINPKKAAGVINLMSSEDKKAIVLRLAKMQKVLPDVVARVDKTMKEKSLALTNAPQTSVDGRASLAEILKRMDIKAENDIIQSLSREDPELGNDLRKKLFTEEDVINSDDRFIQEILRDMTEDEIAYLIAAKSDNFRKKIFSNVSTGRGDIILEEESVLKPMLKTDCEKATSAFYNKLRTAFENGKLVVKGRGDDEYI